MLTIVCFVDLWVNKVNISFYNNWTLRNELNKMKHRYDYTDSALMG